MRTIHRDIVSALIFSKDGKLFQGRKDPKKGGVYATAWHIPGGGVDAGEDTLSALVREIREETGIDISRYEITLVDDIGKGSSEKTLQGGEHVVCEMSFFVYSVFLDTDASNTIVTLNDDLVEYQWTDLHSLHSLELTPPSVALFKRLGYV